MKKALFLLALIFFSLQSFAQKGDLTLGIQGNYIPSYDNNFLYGLNLSYATSDPLLFSFSGLFNPTKITIVEQPFQDLPEYKRITDNLYRSMNIDARFLLLNFNVFGIGPSVGIQYLWKKTTEIGTNGLTYLPLTTHNIGANLGLYAKVNLGEYLRLGVNWQYNTFKNIDNYNVFSLNLGWAFSLR